MQTVVEVRNVGKRYGIEGRKRDGSVTQALDHVSFAVAAGEFTGIMGPSGSGTVSYTHLTTRMVLQQVLYVREAA